MLFIFVDYTIYRGDGTWLETVDISNVSCITLIVGYLLSHTA